MRVQTSSQKTLANIHSASIYGLDAVSVSVEVDVVASDSSSVVIVGLPDMAIRESKDRIFAAIRNSGFVIKREQHCTINLAPSNLKKEGSLYDLPIALGLLTACKVLKSKLLNDFLIIGELGLGGDTRSIRGALALAILAKKSGKRGIILPVKNAKEASIIPNLIVVPVKNLKDAVEFLNNPNESSCIKNATHKCVEEKAAIDFADIKGQAHVKRAMEIVAAGGHNALLCGPPGTGKSMISKALPGILPEMSISEALEVTKIHSIAGMLEEGIIFKRPFRSPHHTISYAGLVGGGRIPRPGEISLAHNGVLFLDEFPEFPRSILEILRQPLEDRRVTISRANGNFSFPTNFICIAAMNPCPCGFLGHPEKPCKDSPLQVQRYQGKISGPILDRIDMHIDVPPVRYQDLISKSQEETSALIRERVIKTRLLQRERFGNIRTNSQMSSAEVKKYCALNQACEETMRRAFNVMNISARACMRILKVARSIADLDASKNIQQKHLMEAISFHKNGFLEKR